MRRIIAVLLENEAGALSRIVGLFAQRNYNIESLNGAPTEDPTLSRVTITTVGDDRKIEQITKHLNRLIEVVKVLDLFDSEHVERELMLIKVRAEGTTREEVKRTCDVFRGQIIDVTLDTVGERGWRAFPDSRLVCAAQLQHRKSQRRTHRRPNAIESDDYHRR